MSTTKPRPLGAGAESAPEPEWLPLTKEAMHGLALLHDNWDTYGAPRIDPAILNSAVAVLRDTMRNETPPPSVVPTSRGGVQLEWHIRGIDLEVEFLSPAQSHMIFEDQRNSTQWEADLGADLTPLISALALLSRP